MFRELTNPVFQNLLGITKRSWSHISPLEVFTKRVTCPKTSKWRSDHQDLVVTKICGRGLATDTDLYIH